MSREAAPLVALAICVPGLRNLVEYQAELLFARGQTLVRAINLGLLAAAKAVLLTYVLTTITDTPNAGLSLNGVFAALYLASTLLTYSALRKPAKARSERRVESGVEPASGGCGRCRCR